MNKVAIDVDAFALTLQMPVIRLAAFCFIQFRNYLETSVGKSGKDCRLPVDGMR